MLTKNAQNVRKATESENYLEETCRGVTRQDIELTAQIWVTVDVRSLRQDDEGATLNHNA